MKEGDTVYDIDGNENILLFAIPGGGFVVEPVYEGPGKPWRGDACFTDRVFIDPPIRRAHAESAAAEAKLAEVQRQLRDATRKLNDVVESYENRVSRLSKRDAALKRIDDFLDGKITHFVVVNWSELTILPIEEMVSEGYCHEPKLLTLFGKTGSLEWRLNDYSDGSGSDRTCYPCCSQEDAVSKVAELIQEAVDDWRAVPEPTSCARIIKAKSAAIHYGMEFPADVLEYLSARAIADCEKCVADRQKKLDDAKKRLDELRVSNVRP